MAQAFSNRLVLAPAELQEVLDGLIETVHIPFHRTVVKDGMLGESPDEVDAINAQIAAYDRRDIFEYGGAVEIMVDIDYCRFFYSLNRTMTAIVAANDLGQLREELLSLHSLSGANVWLTVDGTDNWRFKRLWSARCTRPGCECPKIHKCMLVVTLLPSFVLYGTPEQLTVFQETLLAILRRPPRVFGSFPGN